MKHGHTKLIVCLCVQHKWDADGHWTPIPMCLTCGSYVSHFKNIIFRLGYVSDTTGYGSDTRQTQLGCPLDITGHSLDTPEHNLVLIFQLFDGPKTNLKAQKFKFISEFYLRYQSK